jgi:hypothetical protein
MSLAWVRPNYEFVECPSCASLRLAASGVPRSWRASILVPRVP